MAQLLLRLLSKNQLKYAEQFSAEMPKKKRPRYYWKTIGSMKWEGKQFTIVS